MMLETKTAEGKDVLKLVNENAYWNGRLQEMENMFEHARSSLRDRIDRYKEYQELWSEGKTNLTFILLDEENKEKFIQTILNMKIMRQPVRIIKS